MSEKYSFKLSLVPETKNVLLNVNKKKLTKTNVDIKQPNFSLGFNYTYYDTKNKYDDEEFTTLLNENRKMQRIVLPFEHKIKDNKYKDRDLNTFLNGYFQTKGKPQILDRALLKMWESMIIFDLVSPKVDNFKSLHLAEGPGSFIQGTIMFREMFASKKKEDEYHGITIYNPTLNFDKEFHSYYGKRGYSQFPTYPPKEAEKSANKSDGDLTKLKTFRMMRERYKGKVFDYITADGGFEWTDENYQEQEAYPLIFGEIMGAVSFQKKGGNFYLKVFENFTTVTTKFIMILQSFYNEVYIHKPFTSRETNSERYFVCKDFKFNQKDAEYVANMEIMDALFKDIENIYLKGLHLEDILPSLEIPPEHLANIASINVDIGNQQIMKINELYTFIKKKIYFGSQYQEYIDAQLEATKFWISIFCPKDAKEYQLFNGKLKQLVSNYVKKE
jgi:hypothetical protein